LGIAAQPDPKISGSGCQPDAVLFCSVLGLVRPYTAVLGPAGQQDPTLLLCLEVFWAWLDSQT